MGRHRAVESRIRQKNSSQGVQYGIRYYAPYSVYRSRSSQSRSSLWQSFSPTALADRLAQIKELAADVSRSMVHHPYRWLGVTWLVLVLVGGVATVAMLKIDPTVPELANGASSSENSVSKSFPDQSSLSDTSASVQESQPNDLSNHRSTLEGEQKESLPLFALGSVAMSCAIGCLLLSYRFRPHAPREQSRLPRTHRLPRSSAEPRRSSSAARPAESTVIAPRSDSSDVPTAASVVVPSGEQNPLDWDEPSLADNLDIRQRRPLSHWL